MAIGALKLNANGSVSQHDNGAAIQYAADDEEGCCCACGGCEGIYGDEPILLLTLADVFIHVGTEIALAGPPSTTYNLVHNVSLDRAGLPAEVTLGFFPGFPGTYDGTLHTNQLELDRVSRCVWEVSVSSAIDVIYADVPAAPSATAANVTIKFRVSVQGETWDRVALTYSGDSVMVIEAWFDGTADPNAGLLFRAAIPLGDDCIDVTHDNEYTSISNPGPSRKKAMNVATGGTGMIEVPP